jgi:5-methyltetrahydropteroyltriglutamate--homocysteine methyltransferase
LLNAFYPSQEAYLMHLAGEIAKEYREIVKEGLILQIDAPDLAMDRVMFYQDESEAEHGQCGVGHVSTADDQ